MASEKQPLALANAIVKLLSAPDETSQKRAAELSKDLNISLLKPEDQAVELSFMVCAQVAGYEMSTDKEILSLIGFVQESAEQQWVATPTTYAMTIPAIVGSHKHVWDMGFGTAAKIPEYMKVKGYKSPTKVDDGPLQYAMQTKLNAFGFISSKPDTLEDFNNMMTGVRHSRPSWIEWFPVQAELLEGYRPESTLLIDIGGAWGHDVAAFQRKYAPHAKLELQDLPHVISGVSNLPSNIKCREYDFFKSEQPVKGARAYFFHFILHDWTDDDCLQILRNTAAAMVPGYSKILLNEYVLRDQGCCMSHAMMDLNMLAITAGLERTEKQWRRLIQQSGLEIEKIWLPEGDGEAIIEVACPSRAGANT
ncbi:MAG: hypothetical protein Q9220_002652 [cf. Caloplaca sp. 1 TL-2023]